MKRIYRFLNILIVISLLVSLTACGSKKKDESPEDTSVSSEIAESSEEITSTTPTVVPTDTPTPVPTNTPTPSPKPTETPTPVPTDTPTPEPTPKPKPTKSTKPTKAPTEPTEPKPTETTPKPTDPPPETTPEPTQPKSTDPLGRDFKAEQEAGIAHVKALGYTVTKVYDNSEYGFLFENATGTYKGSAYIMSSKQWSVSYHSVDPNDPNATYSYSKRKNDLIALLDGIDPAWMNYSG